MQLAMLVVIVVTEGHGRSRKVKKGHGWSRSVMEGQGLSWKVIKSHGRSLSTFRLTFEVRKVMGVIVQSAMLVACRIMVTVPVQFQLWIGTFWT